MKKKSDFNGALFINFSLAGEPLTEQRVKELRYTNELRFRFYTVRRWLRGIQFDLQFEK